MKIKHLSAAMALATAGVIGTSVQAAPITYTFSGDFSGDLDGLDFSNTAVTFTGLGDSSALSSNGFSYSEQLLSLSAMADGATFAVTTPSFFYINAYGYAGLEFGALDDSDFFSGQNTALEGYNGATSVATTSLSPTTFDDGQQTTVQTNLGTATLTGESNATFAASTSAVPEPVTWAMMIGGFGLVGGAMRRVHRKSEEDFTRKIRSLAAS